MKIENSRRQLLAIGITAALMIGVGKTIDCVRSLEERTETSVEDLQIDPQIEERMRQLRDPLMQDYSQKKPCESLEETFQPYQSFRFQDELSKILKHSERIGVEPEMLMAIRMAENSSDRVAYGIIPQGRKQRERYDNDVGYEIDGEFHEYKSEIEKQFQIRSCFNFDKIF